MPRSIRFVKGHCGWDTVTLVAGEDVPRGRELETALKIFGPPVSGGLEVGFMYRPEKDEDIRLRIIDSTHRAYLPMCGGMSQVIGQAACRTFFKDHFKIKIKEPVTKIDLLTDSGRVPLEVHIKNKAVTKVVTGMSEYAAFLYKEGVAPVAVLGVNAVKAGYFLVIRVDELKKKFPQAEFDHRQPGPGQAIIRDILRAYMQQQKITGGLYSMLYDFKPEAYGQARLFPRFYDPTNLSSSLPWEFQCGTGTIAVSLALALRNELPFKGKQGTILFEWGSQGRTRDPYGLRTSECFLGLRNKRVVTAGFSHSVTEILMEGRLELPGYSL